MFRRILAIIKKETVQMLRDRVTLVISVIMPLALIVLFGFAISMNVKHIPSVVLDQSMDTASRAYIDGLVNSEYFDIVESVPNQAAVRQAIDHNRAQVGIIIPPDFKAKVERGNARVLILVDGADPFVSLSAYGNANIVAQEYAIDLVMEKANRTSAGISAGYPLQTSIRILYNPDLKDLWFVIPGIVAMILQVQAIALVVASIVREREMGTIEQILVTPIHPIELLLGKLVPNVILLGLNLGMILFVGVICFQVPFHGNLLLFIGLSFIYILACVGLGLLISTISENQTQAFQINLMITLIGLVVSGFIFPRYALPPTINLLGYLFPLTYFIPIARGVISKGIGMEYLWPMVAVLLGYSVLILFLSSKIFKQNID